MKKFLKIIFIIILIAGFAIFLLWILNPGSQGSSSQNFLQTVREFIPFGNTSNEIPEETVSEEVPDNEFFAGGEEIVEGKRSIDATLPDIEQVYNRPIAGFTIVGTNTPIMRVVERETGHIVDINTVTQEQIKRSNTTLPGIRNAEFFAGGDSVILQYVRQNSNVLETLIVEHIGLESQTAGTYLDEGIVSILPVSKNEIIYIAPRSLGSSIISYTISTKSKKTISNISISQVTLLETTNSYVYLETKPTYTSRGYVYRIPRGGGALQKITEGGVGFSSVISEDTNTIFSTQGGSVAFSTLLDRETGNATTYNLKTVASKCTITSTRVYCGVPNFYGNTMPDNWFMGLVSLVDTLWSIDTESGDITLISDFNTVTDITKPHVTDGELYFINKTNGSAWVVRLNQL